MLTFDGVLKALSQGADSALKNDILSLLSISWLSNRNSNEIELIFSGDTVIRLKTEITQVLLQDLEKSNELGQSTVPKHKN